MADIIRVIVCVTYSGKLSLQTCCRQPMASRIDGGHQIASTGWLVSTCRWCSGAMGYCQQPA